MAHRPRHSGGFSQGQSVIGSNTQASLPPSMGFQPSSPTANIGAMNQAAYQSMADQGISSLSGTVTDNQAGQQAAQQQQDQGFQTIQQAAQEANQQAAQEAQKDEGKGLVETLLSNTVVANLLKGAQSTDRFFNNLTEKGVDGLSTEDKVILANLIGRGGLDTIDLNKYTTDDVDFEELGKRFTEAASGLENKDYKSLVDSYLSNKPTGIDSLTTMGSDLFNLFGDPRLRRDDATLPIAGSGSLTLEGLQDALGKEGIAYLKATNPKLYYSFTDPQTSGGLEELAQFDLSTLGGSPEDRRLSARVMAAREATSGQGGGGQTGIPSLYAGPITPSDPNATFDKPAIKYPEGYGAFLLNPPAPVRPGSPTQPGFPDKDGDGVDDRYQAGPGLPRPGIESVGLGIGSPKIPGDKMNIPAALNYANIAPQFTGYTNQGVSPMLGDYYGNLRRFYG
jgi:hypothetical protein